MILFKADVKAYVCYSCINCLSYLIFKTYTATCSLSITEAYLSKIHFALLSQVQWVEVERQSHFLRKTFHYNLNVV